MTVYGHVMHGRIMGALMLATRMKLGQGTTPDHAGAVRMACKGEIGLRGNDKRQKETEGVAFHDEGVDEQQRAAVGQQVEQKLRGRHPPPHQLARKHLHTVQTDTCL